MLFNTLRTSVARPASRSVLGRTSQRSFSTGDESFFEKNQGLILGAASIISLGLIVVLIPKSDSGAAPDAGSAADTMHSQPKQTPPPNYKA